VGYDDINYLLHVRSSVRFRNIINHSALGRCAPSGLVIYSGNVPHGHDITNYIYTHKYTIQLYHKLLVRYIPYYFQNLGALLHYNVIK
jgi:hypothetical protein